MPWFLHNKNGLCSLFTRRVPVETTPHNPPLEILTVSAWHLLDGICLACQSGVKVQRWVVSRMTITTTMLQTVVAKATAFHPPSGLITPWWMTTLRSCSVVSVRRISFDTILMFELLWWFLALGWVFEELHAFLHVCVRFFRGETPLRLLEIIIYHGDIKPLGGWQAVAFAMRTLGGKLGHST